MGNSFKNTWLVVLLIAAGGVILYLSLRPSRTPSDQGMVLNDIFTPQAAVSKPSQEVSAPAQKAKPLPPMVVETRPVGGNDAGFTIQVYSFQDKNRAENALRSLNSNGYQAFLIMTDLGKNRIWYRVRVGGIPDEATAHKMLDEIRKTYNSGFIIQTVDD